MMAKIIPAALLLAIVVGVGQLVICKDQPTETAPSGQSNKRLEVEQKDWAGNNRQVLNLQFGQAPESLTVNQIIFSGLNSKRQGRVKVLITSGSAQAKWLKQKRVGWGYRPGLQRPGAYRPKVRRGRSGTATTVQLIYSKIPVAALGPICGASSSVVSNPLYIVFPGLPGLERQLKIAAPPAPAGACLGQGVKPAISLDQRIKRRGKKITIFGSVTGVQAKRVVVLLSNKSGSFRSKPRPVVSGQSFAVNFRPPRGKYTVRAGLKSGQWLDQISIRVR
jgi:hypothetical protein